MAITQTVVLNVDTDQPQRSIKDARNEIKQYQNSLLNLDKNSKEYQETLRALGKAQQELDAVTNATRAGYGDLNSVVQSSITVASNLAGGFAAVQGAAALFGSQSEDLQKILVRVQAAMALMQGLQGLTGLGRSFAGLRTSLIAARVSFASFNAVVAANPIIAAATAVAGLTAGLIALSKWLKTSKTDTEAFDSAVNQHVDNSERLTGQYEIQRRELIRNEAPKSELIKLEQEHTVALRDKTQEAIRSINALGKLTKDQKELRDRLIEDQKAFDAKILSLMVDHKEAIKDEQAAANKKAAADAKSAAERAAAERKRVLEQELSQIKGIQRQISDYYKSEYQLRVQEVTNTYNEQLALLQKHGIDTVELTSQYNAELKRLETENINDISDTLYAERLEQLNNLRQNNAQAIVETELSQRELQNRIAEAQLDLLNGELGGDSDAILAAQEQLQQLSELFEQSQLLAVEAQVEYLENYANQITEFLEDENLSAEQRIDLETELQNTLNEIRDQSATHREKIIQKEINAVIAQKKKEEEIKKERVALINAYISATSSAASSVSSILGQETAAGKAFAIAAATIDTYKAAASALASDAAGPARYVAFATALATGISTVKNILSTKVPGGADSSSGASTPSIPTTPNIQDFYTPEITEETQMLRAAQRDSVSRVVLVESDVDIAQENSRTRVSESTF